MKIYYISENKLKYQESVNLSKVIGKKVLANNGLIVGRVKEFRINKDSLKLEGFVITRGLFKRALYIGKEYLAHITEESIVLDMEPSPLLKNRLVIDAEGKTIGKVREVIRKEDRNDVASFIVSSFWKKKMEIPIANVKQIGKSIILKSNYHGPNR